MILSANYRNKRLRNFFDQPVKNDIRTYDNIQKITTGRGDDYKTGCYLDYTYFKKYYTLIATDLSKQQAPDVNPNTIQQINFTRNLDQPENTTMFFIIEEAKALANNSSANTKLSKTQLSKMVQLEGFLF